ncbi:hypothetical protein ACF09J_13930 [Streptomyces sp. NPDC014889]|uniref:hypothetical protein n=1 Tax=Streptomyces sp. NPDC014889 TaxID=3364928 RepID=UPI003700D392
MSDRPYTDDDLRAEAARQHHTASCDHDFMGIGEQMDGKPIPSTVVDLEPETGEPIGMGRAWNQLSEEDFEAAQRAVDDLLTNAADVSEWAVNLGADGLEPSPNVLNLDGDGHPLVRLHMAFHSDMSERDRQRFGLALAHVMANAL